MQTIINQRERALAGMTLLALIISTVASSAQSTAFSYQGRLTANGAAANGAYDFRFALYNTATNGASIVVVTNGNTSVTNGLFTTWIDFGIAPESTGPAWLEIAVRPTGSATNFTTLSTRQPVTPAFSALYAAKAGSATTAQSASNLLGVLPATQLPPAAVTNLASDVSISGTFGGRFLGNASGLTNIDASAIASGIIDDARLSTNIARTKGYVVLSGVAGGTNDDTAVFQAAINASEGKTLIIPHGTYTVANLVLPSNISILGNNSTLMFLRDADGYMFDTLGGTNICISDLQLDGGAPYFDPLQSNTPGTRNGIRYNIASGGLSILEHVAVRNFSLTGITLFATNSASGTIFRSPIAQISQIEVSQCFNGIYWVSGNTPINNAEYTSLTGLYVHSCTFGLTIPSANTYIANSRLTDNYLALGLYGSYLSAHGLCANTSFNHNARIMTAQYADSGFVFDSCIMMASSSNPSYPHIWLQGCKGVCIQNSMLGRPIWFESDNCVGPNFVRNNIYHGDWDTYYTNSSTDSGLVFYGNYAADGNSNDRSALTLPLFNGAYKLTPRTQGPSFSEIGVTNVMFLWSKDTTPPTLYSSYFDFGSNRVDVAK